MNKEKIISYLKCDMTNYIWFFPPLLFYLVILIMTVVILVECCTSNNEDEVKHIDMTIAVDTTDYPAEEVIIENDSVFNVPKSHYWRSKEIGLPIGVIYMMDYAGSESDKDHNQNDNYVTIKRTDGSLVVTRDIDVDLYLSLVKGDTIR
jgi:hypothetical protein